MAACGRDLERALGALLAFDVGEIERQTFELADLRLRPVAHLRALEVVGELDQRLRRDELDLRARPRSLWAARIGADQAMAARIGADGGRENTRDGGDRSVEAELAEHVITGE